MKRRNEFVLIVLIVALSAGLCACHKVDERQAASQPANTEQDTASPQTQSGGTDGKSVSMSLPDKKMENIQETFRSYMSACVEKDINAMTDVYDLEHIIVKWGKKVGNDPGEIREMIKGIAANKPDQFYRMCARALKESDKVIEKERPDSADGARIVDLKFEDWSWTFRQRPAGWKLIEEGVSGESFNRISGAQDQ